MKRRIRSFGNNQMLLMLLAECYALRRENNRLRGIIKKLRRKSAVQKGGCAHDKSGD